MATLGELGERELVRRVHRILRAPPDVVGADDDAAVLRVEGGSVVAGTDILTFERHMPEGMGYERFGWSAAAASFSDLASMGARPIGVLASLALPPGLDESALYDIMSGIDQCAEFCGTHVVGGDTKPGCGVACCTALGAMDGLRPMTRAGASPGDLVAVVGELGGPAAGFRAAEAGIDAPDAAFSLMVPVPRVAEGRALAASGAATSCMDLSDGLATAANEICRQSGVGMEIQWELLPVSADVAAVCAEAGGSDEEMALSWGGEYGLLFTMRGDGAAELREAGVDFSIIGKADGSGECRLSRGGSSRRLDHGRY